FVGEKKSDYGCGLSEFLRNSEPIGQLEENNGVEKRNGDYVKEIFVSNGEFGEIAKGDGNVKENFDSHGEFGDESKEQELVNVDEEVDVMALRELVNIERQGADAVYLELEKERNAAATASEEAMAMVLRLQNEKSLIDMEAKQYRRLAEEKQIHDQEVIQSLRWIVMKHESERGLLEDQLRYFRRKSKVCVKGDEGDESEGFDESLNFFNSNMEESPGDALISSRDIDRHRYVTTFVGEKKSDYGCGLSEFLRNSEPIGQLEENNGVEKRNGDYVKEIFVSNGEFGEIAKGDGNVKENFDSHGEFGDESKEQELVNVDEEVDVMALRELVNIERQGADAVYLELEKERNAAATASEEAMAMVLRLQNEKSLIDMEAKQYRRLAEEKQIHDQEVIQSLRWIVMKHESERGLLEDQLRYFRRKSKVCVKGDEGDESEGFDESLNFFNSNMEESPGDALISSRDIDRHRYVTTVSSFLACCTFRLPANCSMFRTN
ncbi:hypothetical protein C3L33_19718, partial [Rhododendron williamsianum]